MFIDDILDTAVQIQIDTGLPAAALTAQVCLETGYGKSVCKDMYSGKYSYNLFNIKGTGPAGSVLVVTWEVYNNVKTSVKAYFKAYNNYAESFGSYVALITGSSNYKPCLAAKNDPEEYCRQLQACHYATDPEYANKIISIMHNNNLIRRAAEMVQAKQTGGAYQELCTTAEKWVQEHGISDGTNGGLYITRDQVFIMLMRTAQKLGLA